MADEEDDLDGDYVTGGQYAGHKHICHIFVCDGIGCTAPAGWCDCGFAERGASPEPPPTGEKK